MQRERHAQTLRGLERCPYQDILQTRFETVNKVGGIEIVHTSVKAVSRAEECRECL